jgi:hypothetical protein
MVALFGEPGDDTAANVCSRCAIQLNSIQMERRRQRPEDRFDFAIRSTAARDKLRVRLHHEPLPNQIAGLGGPMMRALGIGHESQAYATRMKALEHARSDLRDLAVGVQLAHRIRKAFR